MAKATLASRPPPSNLIASPVHFGKEDHADRLRSQSRLRENAQERQKAAMRKEGEVQGRRTKDRLLAAFAASRSPNPILALAASAAASLPLGFWRT